MRFRESYHFGIALKLTPKNYATVVTSPLLGEGLLKTGTSFYSVENTPKKKTLESYVEQQGFA